MARKGNKFLYPPKNATGLDAINWLFRDEFTTSRSAGSVNGTAAEPGIGNRVVTDTNTDLSIANRNVEIVGFTTNGNPGLWEKSFSRTAGLALFFTFESETNKTFCSLGYDNSQALAADKGVFYFQSGTLLVQEVAQISVGDWSADTKYYCLVHLKATGNYFYIKGGAEFPVWTLVYNGMQDISDPIYPAITTRSAVNIVKQKTDFFRLVNLSFSTPIAYDTFTRADGALGNTETTGPDGQSCTARSWGNQVGTTQVASNKAQATALSGGIAIATIPGTTADVYMQSALTRVGDEIGISLRWTDANNYLRCYHDGTNVVLDEVVAGVPNNLITVAGAYAASANLAVRLIGQGAYVWYNNAYIGNTAGINAALTGTIHGTYSTNVGNTNDDFLVMASTGYTQFNQYVAAS